ncbi:MAG: C/D box methylation guide ribonucleoprotein complex aNOP56 subunit [Candidatus Aenigmatarchaeota archaeon]
MKTYINQTALGIFAIDENGKVVERFLYPKDVKKIVDYLENPEENIKKIEEELKKKGFEIERSIGVKNFRKIFKDLGYSDIKLNQLLTEIGIEFSRRKIKQNVKKDKLIIQVVSAIDELDKSINIFIERLREWYGLHYPELEKNIDKHEKFVRIVAEYGSRDKIKDDIKISKDSMGIDISEIDEEIMKEYAKNIRDLYKLREHMEKYVERSMKEIAPNLSEVATPLLAAKLISLSGGLEKMAKMPSSTIQLIGAEKALFRYLRGRGQSPKHGIIYTHPEIQKVPQDKRGKIARILASKISIAVKMDYYGGGDTSERLKEELDKKIKESLVDVNVKEKKKGD